MKDNLSDYIVVFENIVSDELSEKILNEYQNDKNWVNATVANGSDRSVRKCDAINITDNFIISQNEKTRRSIDQELFVCAESAIKKYNQKFPNAKIQGDSGYTLLRYASNEFYLEHTDHFLQAPRSVSCSFALNDDYKGGEWGFFNRQIKFKAPKGSAVMFPSNFMYPHEIISVTCGCRYSIVTWFI